MYGHQMIEELEVETFERPRRLRLVGENHGMHYERDHRDRCTSRRVAPDADLPEQARDGAGSGHPGLHYALHADQLA
jgi:hypothetical protein